MTQIKWQRKQVTSADESGEAVYRSQCGRYIIRQWSDIWGYSIEIDGEEVKRPNWAVRRHWKTLKEAQDYLANHVASEQAVRYPKLPRLVEKICKAVEQGDAEQAQAVLKHLEGLQDTLEEMGEHGEAAAEDVCVIHGSVCVRV